MKPPGKSTEPMNQSRESVCSIPFSLVAEIHRASGKSLTECAGYTVEWRRPRPQIVNGVALLRVSLKRAELCAYRHA